MAANQGKIPPIIRLNYKKGDLIIKQGDYGVSIYKIVKGKVGIFNEGGDREIPLATLGRGEIIGEMTFLNRGTEPRSASVRALEDSELEVWHPSTLIKEYEQMPPIIKYIVNQVIKRLVWMNQLVGKFSAKKEQVIDKGEKKEPGASRRIYYRKNLDQECVYRPVDSSPKVRLGGRIKDISLQGVGLEVGSKNAISFSHKIGDRFYISMVLPSGKKLDFKTKIASVRSDRAPGMLFLGMQLTDISGEHNKTLGFFLRS